MIAWYTRNVEFMDKTLNNSLASVAFPHQQPRFSISNNRLIVDETDALVTLYDTQGDVLYHATSPTRHCIALPGAGIYLIRFTELASTYTQKILHKGRGK